MLVLQWVEQREKKNVGDKMGWATTHFQFWVAIMQLCCDKKGVAHDGRAGQVHNRACVQKTGLRRRQNARA